METSTQPERSYAHGAPYGLCGLVCVLFTLMSLLYLTALPFSADSRPAVSLRRSFLQAATPQVQTSRTCNRFRLPSMYFNDTQGPYNPAAIRLPSTGEWFAVFTLDEVWFGMSNFTKYQTDINQRMRSHPLWVKLGKNALPSTHAPAQARMLNLSEGYQKLAEAEGAHVYKAADWRPFTWRGELYFSHWIAYMPGEERMAISQVDLQKGSVDLLHRFTYLSSGIMASLQPDQADGQVAGFRISSLMPGRKLSESQHFRREKNWGFWEQDGKLLVLYGILPCTVVLEVPLQSMKPIIRSRSCQVPQAPSIAQSTGLDILGGHIHLSGNPVSWDIDRGSSHQELLVMLHTKEPEYVNWGVRMDRETYTITHITAGPLLRNQDYRNEGFLRTALVVSSFHVLPEEGSNNKGRTFIRIFYGEGDRFGCWVDIPTMSIVWHEIGPTST